MSIYVNSDVFHPHQTKCVDRSLNLPPPSLSPLSEEYTLPFKILLKPFSLPLIVPPPVFHSTSTQKILSNFDFYAF